MAALISSPVTHAAPDLWTDLQLLVVDGGIRLVLGVVILVAGWTLATWAKRGLEAALAHLPIDLTLKPLIASLVRYLILIITILLVIEQFGVQTTSLIAVLGAAGLAVGLALQGTLSNVASGAMLLVLRPFRVGHFVEIASGHQGTVREIGLFTTIIITRDSIYVSIPNSEIFSKTVINYQRERLRRVKFDIPVDRANDLDLVENSIIAVLKSDPLVLKDPPPSVVVSVLQEYSVVMTARAMVRSNDYWKALYGLQKDVQQALNQTDILIPVNRQATATRNEPQSAITRIRAPEPQPSQP